jgi:hypothetical protein
VTDFTKIVAGADRPRSSGGEPENYVGTSSIWVLIFGATGNFETHIKKRFKKREVHKKAPLKKRAKMNLTSLHVAIKSTSVQDPY